MHFKRTVEYQTLQGTTPTANSPFWGKDFLLVDVDSSGPVSVDIPPGTYNGVQLAAAVKMLYEMDLVTIKKYNSPITSIIYSL